MTETAYHSSGDNSPTKYTLDFSNFKLNLHTQNGEIFPKKTKNIKNQNNNKKRNPQKNHPPHKTNSSKDIYHQF